MTQLSCGCIVHDYDDKNYTATWQEWVDDWQGEHLAECYGSLCDNCLVMYDARRCKLGGGKL